mgnify:CR=1 FL=1
MKKNAYIEVVQLYKKWFWRQYPLINYLGPECENRSQTKQDFVDHAFCKHPEGAQALLALKDDITDINLPGIYQYYVEGAIMKFGMFQSNFNYRQLR